MKFAIFLFVFLSISAIAQDTRPNETDLAQLTDNLLTAQDDNLDYENIYENYAQLFSHPLNLNKATDKDLRVFAILTDLQINELLGYREKNGNFLSIYELQALPSFDMQTLEKIAPFIVVNDPKAALNKDFVSRLTTSDVYFLSRWEQSFREGSSVDDTDGSNTFQGSMDKRYHKFRASSLNDYSIGFTLEKDAGEKIAWNPKNNQYGYDYFSWHAQLSNKGRIKNLIVGDFQSQFGQGLILGSGFGFGKGAETITSIRKSNIGFLPYTSANESGYMHGVALACPINPRLTVSAFWSRTRRDAMISDDTTSSSFSSIPVAGLHRTSSELQKRKKLVESNSGVVVEYKNKLTELGVILNAIEFSLPFIRRPTPYNQFAFSGLRNFDAGLFFSTSFENVSLFGEVANSLGHGYAALIGGITSISRSTDVAMLFRKYDRDYYSFYGNALSENVASQNETGMYWGLKHKINKRYTVSAYVDIFRFPWVKFGVYQPSTGNEVLGRVQYQPSKKILVFVQWRREQKMKNQTIEGPSYQLESAIKHNFCLSAEYQLHDNIKLKNRFQISEVQSSSTTSGMALIQDIVIRKGKWKITGRYAVFDTDDFYNRQYAYENDMLMAFSFPAYQNTGSRRYAMIDYKVSRSMSMAVRYSVTAYRQQPEENVQTLKAQVLIRL